MEDIDLLPSTQVLTNPDLLYGIFTFVPLASENRDSYMARCAIICRIFHEPAIRVLWRNLDALTLLWHLLAPSSTPFPSDGAVDDELLNYLQTVSVLIFRTLRLAHRIAGLLGAAICRPDTMGPFSMACCLRPQHMSSHP